MKTTPYDYALSVKWTEESKKFQTKVNIIDLKVVSSTEETADRSKRLMSSVHFVSDLQIPAENSNKLGCYSNLCSNNIKHSFCVLSTTTHSKLFSPFLLSGKWQQTKFCDCSCKLQRFKWPMQFPYIIFMDILNFNNISFFHLALEVWTFILHAARSKCGFSVFIFLNDSKAMPVSSGINISLMLYQYVCHLICSISWPQTH